MCPSLRLLVSMPGGLQSGLYGTSRIEQDLMSSIILLVVYISSKLWYIRHPSTEPSGIDLALLQGQSSEACARVCRAT